jgi:hypothetical protein
MRLVTASSAAVVFWLAETAAAIDEPNALVRAGQLAEARFAATAHSGE